MTFREIYQAFSYLVKQQPALFSEQDRKDLLTLIPTLPDDFRKISEALADWCESRPQIYGVLTSLLIPGEMALSPKISRDNPKEYKGELINVLIRSEKPEAEADSKKPESPAEPEK
jgi:hypothetical protein